MSPRSNSEAPDCKKNSKINTCNRTEAKLWPTERTALDKLAIQIYYMMIRTEQRRRNKNRKYNRDSMAESKNILKQYH